MYSKEEALEIARGYAVAASELVPNASFLLFGSYAKGTQRPASDIDVAVLVPEVEGRNERVQNIEDLSFELSYLAAETNAYIEPHLIEWEHDRSGFFNIVVRTGIDVTPE